LIRHLFGQEERHPVTLVLPILWFDIGVISPGSYRDSYYLSLAKSQAAVSADGILFPTIGNTCPSVCEKTSPYPNIHTL